MSGIEFTLYRIRFHHPSKWFWRTLLKGLGKCKADNEPLSFAQIVEIIGPNNVWWLRCIDARVDPLMRSYERKEGRVGGDAYYIATKALLVEMAQSEATT